MTCPSCKRRVVVRSIGGRTKLELAGVDGAAATTADFHVDPDVRALARRQPIVWPWVAVGCGCTLPFLVVLASCTAWLVIHWRGDASTKPPEKPAATSDGPTKEVFTQ